jgi:hypothetical protein
VSVSLSVSVCSVLTTHRALTKVRPQREQQSSSIFLTVSFCDDSLIWIQKKKVGIPTVMLAARLLDTAKGQSARDDENEIRIYLTIFET